MRLPPIVLFLLAGCGVAAPSKATFVDPTVAWETTDTMPADSGTEDTSDTSTPPDDEWPPVACDALQPNHCALPWPSSLYLKPDDTTSTGVALAFGAESLPANAAGTHFRAEHFSALDGYGLGTPIMFDLGPLDYTALPNEWSSLESSTNWNSPTLLLRQEGDTLVPVPHFVEPDRTAAHTLTFLRPAVILEPGQTYIVALRNLTTEDGAPIPQSPAFAALVNGESYADAGISARADAFAAMFGALDAAGVPPTELTLAWSFTTGSEERLQQRLDRSLSAAFADAPDGATFALRPDDTVEWVVADDGSGRPVHENIWYHVHGNIQTPAIVSPAVPGSTFTLNTMESESGEDVYTDGLFEVPFIVDVPNVARSGAEMGVIVYGHGMFGSEWEVMADHLELIAQTYGYVMVGIPMTGMSEPDGDNMTNAILDINNITLLTDGLQQGLVNHHLVARSAVSGNLGTFLKTVDPAITVDPSRVLWFGGSQGGIFGSTFLATSPDVHRGVLAVPGNNYSTMLSRSVNFEPFFEFLNIVYPDPTDVSVVLAAVQLLWDRTDPVSYHHRLYADESGKETLLLLSKGDKQVAVVTEEIAARTFPDTLPVLSPYDIEREPWGVATATYPHTGSGIVLFDFGNAWPSDRGNLPPADVLPDPHGRIAEVIGAGDLVDTFLRSGVIVDVCGGDGCRPD